MRWMLFLSLWWGASAAMAQEDVALRYEIAAVVNDTIITTADLEERSRIAAALTGQPASTPEQVAKLRKSVLQLLIDESLKSEAAESYSITVGKEDIDAAVRSIEKGRGKPEGSLSGYLAEQGLSEKAFRDQIRADLAWSKLLSRVVRKDVKISDEEILRAQQNAAGEKKVPEVELSSVLFPVKNEQEKAKAMQAAESVSMRLKQGEQMGQILESFKGVLPVDLAPRSWVDQSLLDPAIAAAMAKQSAVGFLPPLATAKGVQLIHVYQRREKNVGTQGDAEVALKQIILTLNDDSDNDEIDVMLDMARSIARAPGTCQEKGVAGAEGLEDVGIKVEYVRTTLSTMSQEIRPIVERLGVTGISEPFAAPDGIHLLMLCERIDIPGAMPAKEQMRQVLFQQKLELEAEKYLRNLRRDAFVDIRL